MKNEPRMYGLSMTLFACFWRFFLSSHSLSGGASQNGPSLIGGGGGFNVKQMSESN